MSAPERGVRGEEHAKPRSGTSDRLLSAGGGSVLELSMQCPFEDVAPSGERPDLLTHVGFIESIYADGPAKAAYVNGSGSPGVPGEVLLDISKNVPGFLPGDGDALRKDAREVWDFGADPVEEPLDWDREFLEFFMEEPGEKRKRKADPSGDVRVRPEPDSGEAGRGAPRPKYANGTKVTFDHLPSKPARGPRGGQNRTFVRGYISVDSGSDLAGRGAMETPPPRCEGTDRNLLPGQGPAHRRAEGIDNKKRRKKKRRRKDTAAGVERDRAEPRSLRCPQCPFATDRRAHGKDKRRRQCSGECSYGAPDHAARKHPPEIPQEKCKGGNGGAGGRGAGQKPCLSTRMKKNNMKKKNGKAVRSHAKVPKRAPPNKEEGARTPTSTEPRAKNPKRSQHPGSPRPLERDGAETKDPAGHGPPRKIEPVPDKPRRNETHPEARDAPEARLPLDSASTPEPGNPVIPEEPLGNPVRSEPARGHGPKKSPPKRDPSTPFHSLQGRDMLIDFPKCREMFRQDSSLYLIDQRGPGRGPPGVPAFSVKEDWAGTGAWPGPTAVSPGCPAPANGEAALTLKRCLYCPALFDSGIGLSNHVRGHLHRASVSHGQGSTSGEGGQRRRKVHARPRVKKEVGVATAAAPPPDAPPPEPKPGLTCPLCRERFESKTGLSNHVRGHLKRLGRPCSTKSLGSPVLVLRALMRDEQHRHKLQALKASLKARGRPPGAPGSQSALAEVDPPGRCGGVQDESKASPSSDLIGILKKRRAHEEARARTQPPTTRKAPLVPPGREGASPEPPPDSGPERGKANPRVCVHCNATFYSGVALSNHLRAYLRRKQTALLEGTTYDCSKRKQRSRSGSKKKVDPSLQTPEDLYRLTCRFCDLVFQGPLSVQEDWVKHLQRHIMNTGVAHTGVAMTEVSRLPDPHDAHTQAAV